MSGDIRLWLSRSRATKHAVRENRKDREHPAFHLWSGVAGQKMRYEGRLESGDEFDHPDPLLEKHWLCWNKAGGRPAWNET